MKKITIIITLLLLLLFCKVGISQSFYTIKNLKVNSKYSDFGVSFESSTNVVYASSKGNGAQISGNSKQSYLELFQGSIDKDGEISENGVFSKQLKTKYHVSNAIFTKDKKTVYFNRNYDDGKFKQVVRGFNNIKLFKATISDSGQWGNILALPFNNVGFSVGHPALNEDETYLYFTSDMPGGFGLTDIYRVKINNDGSYGLPENLGPRVNTSKKEMFPYVYKNTLYFSSEGHNSLGGFDIFKAEITSTKIEDPTNLGDPFNSLYDDFSFVNNYIKDQQEVGFFSSNRPGGKGDDDIYYFEKNKCNQLLQGVVKSKKMLDNAIAILYDSNNKISEVKAVDSDGKFSFQLDCEKQYKVAVKNGNNDEKEILVNANGIYGKENQIEIVLEEESTVARGETMINVNPIYFDSNSSIITKDAAIELNKVVAIMNKFPNLLIECNAHTDSRGNDNYNLWLSERRALNTVKYIISKGIAKDRITYNGYGETMLINKFSDNVEYTESERQENRKVEFVITNFETVN